jgi:integrase
MQKQDHEDINNNNDKLLYSNFIYSLKTQITRETYLKYLKYYMKFLGVSTFKELIEGKPQKIIESNIKAYLVYLRNEKKISYDSAIMYLAPIRKFYHVNSDFNFKWDLITSYLGNDDTDEMEKESESRGEDTEIVEEEDRPYTKEEIHKMLNAAQDIRVKILISLLSSSGLRHGALPNLKLKDIEKIEKYNIYKITAYRNSKKFRYHTFCSPECRNLIDRYLEYRRNKGEELNCNSPLIREQFNTNDKLKINNPKHLTSMTLRFLINDVLTKYTDLRKKLKYDYENNRKIGKNSTMLTHAFRKFFTVECTKAGVYHEIVEKLVGHKIPGSRNSYLIFNHQTLLEGTAECKGYVAAIEALTINEENRLQKQVLELKEQDDYHKYVIDKKMKEKDEQIKSLQDSINFLTDTVNRALSAGESVNNIITNDDDGMGIVKGIELKPEIKNKAIGQVQINPNNKKK